MSESQHFDFGRLVPGFDFLQNLAKGATQGMPQMPGLGSWIAPTLSVEELDKRINELRAVQFWIEQNGRALQATLQALEVQKMTLATLEGMNFSMADLAEAMKLKPQPEAEAPKPAKSSKESKAAKDEPAAGPQVVDPLQWWNSLTRQFQQIATDAMQQAAQQNPAEAAREMAADMAQGAMDAARRMGEAATAAAPRPARKTAARKPAAARKATPAKTAARGGTR